MAVQAQVVDLRSYTPSENERFYVDTNVWYWLTYDRIGVHPTQPPAYQTTHYPAFIKEALNAKSQIHSCALNFAELTSVIENAELAIHNHVTRQHLTLKQFRQTHHVRKSAIVRVNDSWELVKAQSTMLEAYVGVDTVDRAAQRLTQDQSLDGYDLFLLETITRAGIDQVVTDDKDFLTVPGITVFTANHHAIRAAKAVGKLKTGSQEATVMAQAMAAAKRPRKQ